MSQRKSAQPMKMLDDRALEHVAKYFRALSEPVRLKILNALRQREYNVTELTELCGCTQANVSKHLSLLAQARIVKRENRGTSVYYCIIDSSIYAMCDLVCSQLAAHFADQAALYSASNAKPISKARAKRR